MAENHAIELLYQTVKSELLAKIEMPRYKRTSTGELQEITTLEHLENLVKLFKLSPTSTTQAPQ
ncbi:MAG: hypothetical protein HYT64_00270 [Candidatus Yanofskybacteria bacterium]|nr:hypothetical protein [Candidatus Yanofskybacteria bacterium]